MKLAGKDIVFGDARDKVDAIICWDLAVIQKANNLGIPIHISTLANISNTQAVRFYENLGVKRLVLARELSLEQIKQIKKKDEFRNIPVVALTAQAMKGDKERIMGAGFDDYIAKPFDPEELLQKVSKLITEP